MTNNCSSCGCNSCRNIYNNSRSTGCNSCGINTTRSCGALRHIGCDSCSRCASAYANTTCAGYPLYYEGPCPCANPRCGGYCAGNCGGCHHDCHNNCHHDCHNNCHHDCGCGENAVPWRHGFCAAEFAAYAPQNCCAGGSLNFRRCSCHGGGFSECSGGVRVENTGVYMLTYTFSAPQGMNAASHLCLACGGAPIPASGAYIAPVTCANSRTAMGQALVELHAGDVISLTTSTAMDICDGGWHSPVATLILSRIG